ncbi:MAG: LysR family transcriptional regulator [Bacteroidetes bacterium]|nr:LysR family transcriptional regulator [Bacteroidota bacterium]MBU1371885.1 LysR family transcriptional regulator [Bacteroidota bacterium]MBU1483230.1 LysR family transcriptional regulator [Bacteroidota bacterium]MBU1759517.1 LysR family transcriptional regulator [Bacteroidota bacterium]MBU2046201.1 LysR family transcriptional regulator [Bacteroidota bacterium]
MTIVQLEYAVAVDTYRSFVLAAEKCFVTQPTLSMQIQKLEEHIGVKLFDRSRQPVIPTEIGVEIIEQARKILQESYKIKEIIEERKGELAGELKIGVIPTIAPYLLPRVIGGFIEKYPKVKLTISELTTESIIHQIKVGLLDCGILATPLDETLIIERPVFYENFVSYLSKSSPVFKKKAITTDDLDVDNLWLLNEGHCMRNQVLNICQHKKSNHAQLDYNTGSIETLIKMVDLNNGITILPELSIQDFSIKQMDKIRYFKSPEPSREVSIVTHKNFIKKRVIDALEIEILNSVPKRMKSKKKKEIIAI